MTNLIPQLFRVVVPVRDINQAVAFYTALLGFPGKRVSKGRHYFHCGPVILACYDAVVDGDADDHADFRRNPHYLFLSVPDLNRALEAAETAGAFMMEGIATQASGEQTLYLTDPFGNPLCLVRQGTEFTGLS